MRNRTYGINIRVTKQEKELLEAKARKANVTLSAYLRRAGTGDDMSRLSPAERYGGIVQGVDHGNHEDQTHQG